MTGLALVSEVANEDGLGQAAQTWQELARVMALINARRGDDDLSGPLLDRFFALQDQLLTSDIGGWLDAFAVALGAGLSTVQGRRTDGADAEAYQRVLAWLGAQQA